MTVRIHDDHHARLIAAGWQSPGTIGHTLASLASGVPVDRDALTQDIDNTLRQDNPTGMERDELVSLRAWATTTSSPLVAS